MMRHTWLVIRREMAHDLRRPLFWVWFFLFALAAWSLANGNLKISVSGDSGIGGTKQWITSEFSYAQLQTVLNLLMSGFFVAIGAGLCVIRDEEFKVHPLLLSTQLTPRRYIWGKFLGTMASIGLVILAQTVVAILVFHCVPTSNSDEMRGPFALLNYLRPVILFTLPMVMFVGGVSFAVGEWTRRPVLVFVLPTALLMVFGLFMSGWSPDWLSRTMNQVLMLAEPYGFRWLRETWLKVDLGVEFYNRQRIPVDLPFALSRLAFALCGLLAVAATARHFAHTFRAVRHGAMRRRRAVSEEPAGEIAPVPSTAWPAMRTQAPGFLRGLLAVVRFEVRLLLFHPAVYLFVPFVILQAVGTAELVEGPFNTPLLITPGTLAMGLLNTLTLLISLLLLFFAVDALERERSTGLAPIFHATGVPTASILFGKMLATAALGAIILLATLASCVVMLWIQGSVPISYGPFGLVWGLMLVPTFIVWSGAIGLLSVVTRNRYSVLALAALILLYTFYRQFTGQMNWVGNWNLWGTARWSDISRLELDGVAILWNRLLYLSVAVLLAYCSVQLFGRQAFDAARVVRWFRAPSVLRAILRAAPFLAMPFAIGLYLWLMVWQGHEGGPAERKQKDYWRQNMATWAESPTPALQHVELDLEFEPARRSFHVRGAYRLRNQRSEPLRQIALTAGFSWRDERWTLDGRPAEPEDRSRLMVFSLPAPLQPEGQVEIGFEYEGTFPQGIGKMSSGQSEFILPSSVVLTSFSPSFVPVVGFVEGIGVDKENHYEPKQYDELFYEGDTPPLLGTGDAFSTCITIHGPEDSMFNCVGVLESSSVRAGRRTSVWKSDHPVHFFNVVGGRWQVREGPHTKVFYDPRHAYNVGEMSLALESAYQYYSQWFLPYPWRELKLSEFANLAGYAQGFPTNITFSEGIGFLTRDKPGSNAAFLITAHEAAHQWWGNLLVPGKGPGGNVLSEGMAHFSTGLLLEQVKGLPARIEFFDMIERGYNEQRSPDSERPLARTDGSKEGDSTVMYDKGGWVFWMLLNQIGRERTLQGLQQFIRQYRDSSDHPVIQDLIAHMRPLAPDAQAYDDFARQWFLDVVLPQYRFEQAECRRLSDRQWEVTAQLTNVGTGRVRVEVAATTGDRFDDASQPRPEYRDCRTAVTLGNGEQTDVKITCDFQPRQLVVDPDRLVLQLKRKHAEHRF